MFFSIGENGDIYYDQEYGSFSNIVVDEEEITSIKMARTAIVKYFVYDPFFKEDFVLNKRNTKSEEEIKKSLDEYLNTCFKNYPKIRSKVKHLHLVTNRKMEVLFYYEYGHTKKTIMLFEVEI